MTLLPDSTVDPRTRARGLDPDRTVVPGTDPRGLDELIDERRPGYSLEAPFYTSPDFFARDVEAIFASTWIFVGSVAEVPEPGDFVT
ncbi:aromatic ring-hydroxylating dioxygenase subunit alpha, partial [Burkholderia multivorans]